MRLDMSNMIPSVLNAALFFLLALATIPVGKFLLSYYHIPGLSELAQAI